MVQLSMQTVVAGLIWSEGKLLIAQRRASGPHPLAWEFPGGKVESGETEQQALIRELEEELGIEAEIGTENTRYEYTYPGKAPILLVFFHVERYQGKAWNKFGFESLVWEALSNFSRYRFLAGDLPLIQLLREIHIDQVE